ncbi:hypothetical protein DRN67_01420 [Candidatus Micrarchaeota archaeon]|nr:MAG: hypothetical protein DRN67_01420 [Candidatus Micrarchaeota archaeon]
MGKEKLLEMLNKAVELEHAARIQYMSHAGLVAGRGAEGIIARLKEIASDELEHEGLFRECIAILGGTPSMKLDEVYEAKDVKSILEVNLREEKKAVDFYKEIYKELQSTKGELQYEYEYIEHRVRHVIIDEQEHALELTTLMG